jgi:hypothetical protein
MNNQGSSMYFPYLHARQFELLALRAMLSDHRPLGTLVPIIEPVMVNPPDITKCIEEFGQKNQRLIVVMNPVKHELRSHWSVMRWRNDVVAAIAAQASILPAFRCTASTSQREVRLFLDEFRERDVVIAYSSPSLTDAEVTALADEANVRFHIVLNGQMSAHKQSLLPQTKRVDVRDYFNKLSRNADYGSPEFFSDRDSTFEADGWVGFGDYCCFGSELDVGPGSTASIVLHGIFKHTSGEIWVEHFVSDDTEVGVGHTASKFLQAAGKLVKAADARPGAFGKNFALGEFAHYARAGHFPNLGKSKQLQIEHHLCLMIDVLSGAV